MLRLQRHLLGVISMLLIFFKTFEKFFLKVPLSLHRASQRQFSEKRPISLSVVIAVVLVTWQEYRVSWKLTDWGRALGSV